MVICKEGVAMNKQFYKYKKNEKKIQINNKKSVIEKNNYFLLFALSILLITTLYGVHFNQNSISNGNSLTKIENPFVQHLIVHSTVIGRTNPNTTVWITITLNFQNESELNLLLSGLNNPRSLLFHHYLSEEQFINNFSPNKKLYNDLVTYLKSKGLSIEYTWKDRLTITIMDPVYIIEKAFGVTFYNYKTDLNGYKEEFWSVSGGNISFPSRFAPFIKGIDGLTNASKYNLNLNVQGLVNPYFYANGVFPYLYSSDLQKAYNTIELYNNSPTAAPSTTHIFAHGRTIVTILWEGTTNTGKQVAPFYPSDIFHYYDNNMPLWERNAGGVPHIWGIGTTGTVKPGSSAANDYYEVDMENTLDLEYSGMQAPGSNVVNVYGPGSGGGPSESNFPDNEYNIATNTFSNLSAVSNSWGGTDTLPSYAVAADVQELNAKGVTVFASAGDNGDTTSQSYPATFANNTFGIVAVGGTTLDVRGVPTPDGTGTSTINPIASQIVWYDNGNTTSTGAHWGTTSGTSSVYPMPIWQDIPAVTGNGGSTSGRDVADVAAVANNSLIYITNNYFGGSPNYYSVGGTSIASPTLAGQITEIDAYLGIGETGNGWGLGYIEPLLYQIGPNNTKYASLPFFDITSNPVNYHNPAKVGWDYPSGWGSINSWNFTMALKFWMNSNPHSLTIAAGLSGSTTVSVYYPTLYNSSVHLSATGLPAGATASFSSNVVDPSPNNKTAGTSTLTINTATTTVPGTYTLTVTGVNYNKNSNTYGNLTNITDVIVTIVPTYSVTFTESGLPANTIWYVNLSNGQSFSSTTSTITFNEPNGTYTYTVATGDKEYAPSPASGTFIVIGAPVSESITFALFTYKVIFTEGGLASGTNWSVTLNSHTKSSTTGTITFMEVNGSYSYTIANVSGYTVSPLSGHVIVNGKIASISITFTSNIPTYQNTITNSATLYSVIILIIIIIIVVIAVVIIIIKKKGKSSSISSTKSINNQSNQIDGITSNEQIPPQQPPAIP